MLDYPMAENSKHEGLYDTNTIKNLILFVAVRNDETMRVEFKTTTFRDVTLILYYTYSRD